MRQVCDKCGNFYEPDEFDEDKGYYTCHDCVWDSTLGDGLDDDDWEQE